MWFRYIFLVGFIGACELEPEMFNVNYGQDEKLQSYEDNAKKFRLGDESIPFAYKLTIAPPVTVEEKLFKGEVEIHFNVTKEVNSVVLNQEDLSISVNELYDLNDDTRLSPNQIPLKECIPNEQYQKYECRLLSDTLKPGKGYLLYLKYQGKVHNDMRGLYRSFYSNENDKKEWAGISHLGQQARRLLPCFDEPRFKAQFELTVSRNPKVHKLSISNAQLIETTEVSEVLAIDTYKPTSKIPSYALALIVSNFAEILDFDSRENHTFGAYARTNAEDQLSFAFQLGQSLVREMSEWTQMDYYQMNEVDKLDIVAVPDLPVEAMGNSGLLVHREANLLQNDDFTNTFQMQKIGLTLSHEISHMWFGILVTSDWFDTIWLNEGFATYFEFVTLNTLHPEWKLIDSFAVQVLQNALLSDASSSAHALTNPNINSYPEIRTMFTEITYNKGASLLRMMHSLMQPEKFQRAIRSYLEKKSSSRESTVKPNDLFYYLEMHDAELKPKEIMKSFTEQIGVPLVTVKREGNTLTLNQKRFLIETSNHNDKTAWNIPVTIVLRKQDFLDVRSNLVIFPNTSATKFEIKIEEPSLGFYLLNVQQVGYYRVNYDENNWFAIEKALKSPNFGGIHVLNRVQIVDDLFNLARSGHLTYGLVLKVIEYIKSEKEYLPWLAAFNGLSFLESRFRDSDYKQKFNVFVNELVDKIQSYLGYASNGTHTEKLNRIQVLDWTCRYGKKSCIDLALTKFQVLLNGNLIDPDWLPFVYCTAIRKKAENWDKLWNKYLTSNFATEKTVILQALGCSADLRYVHKFLSKILTEDIRLHEKLNAYRSAYSGNPENVDYVFEYVTGNHGAWSKVMDIGMNLAELSNRFTTDDQIKKLEDFIKNTKLSEATIARLKAAVQISKKNIQWDKQRIGELKTYFAKGDASTQRNNFIFTILSLFIYFMFN